LGVVGWALCTGHLPITAATPAEILLRRLQESPPPLDQVAPGLPSALRRSIRNALADDPGQRPATMEQWVGALDGAEVMRAPALPLVRSVETGNYARPFFVLAFSLVGMLTVTLQGYWGLMTLPLLGRFPAALAMIVLTLGAGALVHVGL